MRLHLDRMTVRQIGGVHVLNPGQDAPDVAEGVMELRDAIAPVSILDGTGGLVRPRACGDSSDQERIHVFHV